MIQDQHIEDQLLRHLKHVLLDSPEMVLLVEKLNSVKYLNNSARNFFGDIQSLRQAPKTGRPSAASALSDIIRHLDLHGGLAGQTTFKYNGNHLEVTFTPATSHQNDILHWLFVKDIDGKTPNIGPGSANIQMNDKVSLIGSSKPMLELLELISQVADTDTTILITGESGTGKEIVADLIQHLSRRKSKPYLKINCNAINDSILESELFGHEKGAFTGAEERKKGKFEVVDGGTIFLDEIGDISPRMQSSLLRVLQDGEIIRVGGNHPVKVNNRIIAATNTDLAAAVQGEKFRLDLFYRLNILHIPVPPLRDRKDDIELLASYFIMKYRTVFKKNVQTLSSNALTMLRAHDWPGNVRELENLIQRALLVSKTGEISEKDLSFALFPKHLSTSVQQDFSEDTRSLKSIMAGLEKGVITDALIRNQGNVAATAIELKIGKTALYEKMRRYDISQRR